MRKSLIKNMKKIWIIIKRIFKKCLGILYPQTCCFCGKVSKKNICEDCVGKIQYIEEPRCKRCGKPVRYERQEYCYDCQGKEFFFEQGKNVWMHTGVVKQSIYQFKYRNRRIYGEFYAKEMYRLFGTWIRENGIDLIIPVPLHAKRRKERGYNQAEILAECLGGLTGIRVEKAAVIRRKYTSPQKRLDNKERRKNLHNAFAVVKDLNSFKNILIVDDIYTTGSTINEVAKTITLNFTSKVWFLTISIGQGF